MYPLFKFAVLPTSGLLEGASYTQTKYLVQITNLAKGIRIDENASAAVEDQDIAGGQLHREPTVYR
jgi:hypothetical protein